MPKKYSRNCDQCGTYYVSSATRFCSEKCYRKNRIDFPVLNSKKARENISKRMLSEKNPLWKGEKVGYHALHKWVIRRIQKPAVCDCCKVEPPRDLANKGIYNRELENWEWLCRRCHMKKDGRLGNLKKMRKKKTEKKTKTNEWYRKECVKVAKKIVRIRDKNTCQRCGRTDGALHCSHVYPEGTYHSLSANPLNMKVLCFRCHYYWWHKDIIEAKDWFSKTFPERLEILRPLAIKPMKVDFKSYLEELKNTLSKMV